jgi:hypothetical protein
MCGSREERLTVVIAETYKGSAAPSGVPAKWWKYLTL